ncbi:MAG: hypothetical protein EBU82_09705 [Flavobacteriia bacterium]|nr:hypothetical protein [Flavobacteriia bacterium]
MSVQLSSIAIVTPTHKDDFDFFEILRLKTTLSTLETAPHFFLLPQSLDDCRLKQIFPNSEIVRMPDWFFKSVNHYNVLMLQEALYNNFLLFEFILLCQTDSFVIGDINPLFSFDYFGASWKSDYRLTEIFGQIFVNRPNWLIGKNTTVSAGNGGLSVRNVNRMIEMVAFGKTKPYWPTFEKIEGRKLNEDVIFSFLGTQRSLKIPTREVADSYFVETKLFNPYELNGIVGFHALEKYQPGIERHVFEALEIDFPR